MNISNIFEQVHDLHQKDDVIDAINGAITDYSDWLMGVGCELYFEGKGIEDVLRDRLKGTSADLVHNDVREEVIKIHARDWSLS